MTSNNDRFLAEDQNQEVDFVSYIFGYLRYWYWFILSIAISLTAAYFYLQRLTPMYRVYATLLIKDEQSPRKPNDVVEDFTATANKRIENEIVLLKSRSLLGKVVADLDLTTSYWIDGPGREIELYDEAPIKLTATEVNSYAYSYPLFVVCLPTNQYRLLDSEKKTIGVFDYGRPMVLPYGRFRIFRKK